MAEARTPAPGSDSAQGFVRIRNLVKRFGAFTAVDHVSIEVGEGHTLALLGPSGCGKTTILRCIAGLETPEGGSIEIAGRKVYDGAAKINLMPEKRELGIVFQSYAVWPHMTVAENIGFPLKVRGVDKAEMRAKVEKIVGMVGLTAMIDRSATALSGGQQQRVALARALVHEPRLVLFDEALSNLDAQLREQMRMELKVLQDRLGFTAIYVTHDQGEAFGLAEHVVVMNRGHIETAGNPREVFRRPATPFVARFLGLNVHPGKVLNVFAGGPDHAARQYAEVAVGERLKLFGAVGQDEPVKPGQSVVACLRREQIKVRPAGGVVDGAQGVQTIKGRILAASFQGLSEEYIVDAGGTELRVIQHGGNMDAGTQADIRINTDDCIVLAENAGAAVT